MVVPDVDSYILVVEMGRRCLTTSHFLYPSTHSILTQVGTMSLDNGLSRPDTLVSDTGIQGSIYRKKYFSLTYG